MTERTISLLVTLDAIYREDDAEIFINTIEMIKGVLKAQVVTLDLKDRLNETSVKNQLQNKFYKLAEKVFEDLK